jgi:LmbE family N-acetylglucosaminyl deacetylase
LSDAAQHLIETGYHVDLRTNLENQHLKPGSYDAAVVVEFLENEEWDRWALQKIHRALKSQGLLVAAVPNMTAMGSPNDWVFLLGRIVKQVRLRAGRLFGVSPSLVSPFGGRRYFMHQVESILSAVGFEIQEKAVNKPGLVSMIRPFSPKLADHLSGMIFVAARKQPSVFGLGADADFPDPDAHRKSYEASASQFIALRNSWLKRFPQFAPRELLPIDPTDFDDKTVLVLAPHPDDEIIGCGGTLARMIESGARVTVIQATDGADSVALSKFSEQERREIRLAEAEAVANLIGVQDVLYWREPNGALSGRKEIIDELIETIRRIRPSLMLVPFMTDIHGEHRVLTRIASEALGGLRSESTLPEIFQYEVWSLTPANRYCDVSGEMNRLEELFFLYETAMKIDDFVHFCADRNYYHSLSLAGQKGFAEAFYASSARDFVAQVCQTGEASG